MAVTAGTAMLRAESTSWCVCPTQATQRARVYEADVHYCGSVLMSSLETCRTVFGESLGKLGDSVT